MELGSAFMTPISDGAPVVLQYKFYWIHERLWDEIWIAKYHAQAPDLAREMQARNGRAGNFTCDDFAFQILIEFASRNKLPLKIKTDVHFFQNIDVTTHPDAGSPATPQGFAQAVAYAGGAHDVVVNSLPVSLSDLQPGDMLAEFNEGHIQVVAGVSENRIEIMQGNFPGPETVQRKLDSLVHGGKILRGQSVNERDSPYYLGVPVQNAVYENRAGKWCYQRFYGQDREWDDTVWPSMNKKIRWNFMEFNKL